MSTERTLGFVLMDGEDAEEYSDYVLTINDVQVVVTLHYGKIDYVRVGEVGYIESDNT